jgi:hypothetical protein
LSGGDDSEVTIVTIATLKCHENPLKVDVTGCYKRCMTGGQLCTTLGFDQPPAELTAPVAALWWDRRGDWAKAHSLVDDLETADGMAVHAYLHRKEGEASNADYWYRRAGRHFHRESLEAEWDALVEGLSGK